MNCNYHDVMEPLGTILWIPKMLLRSRQEVCLFLSSQSSRFDMIQSSQEVRQHSIRVLHTSQSIIEATNHQTTYFGQREMTQTLHSLEPRTFDLIRSRLARFRSARIIKLAR